MSLTGQGRRAGLTAEDDVAAAGDGAALEARVAALEVLLGPLLPTGVPFGVLFGSASGPVTTAAAGLNFSYRLGGGPPGNTGDQLNADANVVIGADAGLSPVPATLLVFGARQTGSTPGAPYVAAFTDGVNGSIALKGGSPGQFQLFGTSGVTLQLGANGVPDIAEVLSTGIALAAAIRAANSITGTLSAVTDANARAVLASIISAITGGNGARCNVATNNTT